MSLLDMQITEHNPSMVVRIWSDGFYSLNKYKREVPYIDLDLYDFESCSKFYNKSLLGEIIEEYIGPDPLGEN